ncbi:MAG TPA: hypothetical protein VLB84_08005, partial [Bacteroidia bacterium]|nr:hypothetical protein [Bacteroidia bacterium]
WTNRTDHDRRDSLSQKIGRRVSRTSRSRAYTLPQRAAHSSERTLSHSAIAGGMSFCERLLT